MSPCDSQAQAQFRLPWLLLLTLAQARASSAPEHPPCPQTASCPWAPSCSCPSSAASQRKMCSAWCTPMGSSVSPYSRETPALVLSSGPIKVTPCRGRTHIHLAPGLPGDPGVISGMRPNCEVAVFINGPLALADGIPFFRSANGVILTPGNADGFLLPKYFKEALQLRPTRKPLSLSDNEGTECQSGPRHTSRGRTMIQQ
uniref:tRNA phosphotransferase 1 n=1 Tax=Rousettus aegyptiacus TaxID=9407 RepID=A0A7J8H8S8_ROUAE|nr:tRNA phosphotransferase 1 [Rousettus aegyptiacus]